MIVIYFLVIIMMRDFINNSPIQYLEGMSYDHPYVEMYRHCDIILCCGQGAWEDEMIYSTHRMQELLENRYSSLD